MKNDFKIHKLPLDNLIQVLIELYDSGVDYVDLSADHTDPNQDKLVIQAKEDYINPEFVNKGPSDIEIKKLSDDDIDKLI